VSDLGPTLPNDSPRDRFVALTEDAIRMAGDDDEAVAAATTQLAAHLVWRGADIEPADALSQRGLEAAERAGDAELLVKALAARAEVLAGTPRLDERLRVTERYMTTCRDAGLSPLNLGYQLRVGAVLSGADRDGFDALNAEAQQIAADRPWWFAIECATVIRALGMILDGDLMPTVALISPHLGTFADEGISPLVAHFALVWRELDRAAELIPLIEAIRPGEASSRLIPTLLLLAKAETGDLDGAAQQLERLAADDFAALFRSFGAAIQLAMVAEACWLLGDAARAAQILPYMEPFAGQVLVIPPSTAVFGAADRFIGLLAATIGDRARAIGHLETSLAIETALRAPLLAGHTAAALAALLDNSDAERAAQLRAGAAASAERLGAARLSRLATS
jgi:hypothetical protein